MNYYLQAFKQYAVFTGRTARKDYWMFILFNFIISIIFSIILVVSGLADSSASELVIDTYKLVILLPSLSISVRRLHDANFSGWWAMLPFVSIFMCMVKGNPQTNKYGPPTTTTM